MHLPQDGFFRHVVGVGALHAFRDRLVQLLEQFDPEAGHVAVRVAEIHRRGGEQRRAVVLEEAFVYQLRAIHLFVVRQVVQVVFLAHVSFGAFDGLRGREIGRYAHGDHARLAADLRRRGHEVVPLGAGDALAARCLDDVGFAVFRGDDRHVRESDRIAPCRGVGYGSRCCGGACHAEQQVALLRDVAPVCAGRLQRDGQNTKYMEYFHGAAVKCSGCKFTFFGGPIAK